MAALKRDAAEAIISHRGRFFFQRGERVVNEKDGNYYEIQRVIDLDHVLCWIEGTRIEKVLRLRDLKPTDTAAHEIDLALVGGESWEIAGNRRRLIEPLLNGAVTGRARVNDYAKEHQVSAASLYRWVKRYAATDSMSALIPKSRGWKPGLNRLDDTLETVIREGIQTYYLSNQRLTQQNVIKQIRIMCKQRNLDCPSDNTLRKRMQELSQRDVLRQRGHREKAKNLFQPKPGRFPDVKHPLEVIQIDHTPMDVILVDDKTREPIGRPWLTVAIDVYSRMICGYYLSLDAPSETSVAMCIAHCALPKEEWLAAKNVSGDWKVWGIPQKIHVDNGSDFRSETLKRACLEYEIVLEHRPVRTPNYGGHIERLIGTLMREIHTLPGATFSNIQHRDGYESEKHAIMAFDELEQWLLHLIVNQYHKRVHSSTGMTPDDKWFEGLLGESGIGLPPVPVDRRRLMLDFMPFEMRSIQPYGVTWDGVRYFDHILPQYIGQKENGKARQALFRRDPRDISVIYFRQPETGNYYPIPTADQSFPHMSLWQLKESKRRLKERGMTQYSEAQLIETTLEMQRLTNEAARKTKTQRRKNQRTRLHQRQDTPVEPSKGNHSLIHAPTMSPDIDSDFLTGEVTLFEDIE